MAYDTVPRMERSSDTACAACLIFDLDDRNLAVQWGEVEDGELGVEVQHGEEGELGEEGGAPGCTQGFRV